MESKLKNRVEMTKGEWFVSGVERYGFDQTNWKFRCPACGEVFQIRHWTEKKSNFSLALQDCPNATILDDPGFCVWHGFGSLNPVHIRDEKWEWLVVSVFDYADKPLNGEAL